MAGLLIDDISHFWYYVGMVKIPLTNSSLVALVDDADAPLVSAFHWQRMKAGHASGWVKVNGMRRKMLMHRFILNAAPGTTWDHINGDGLDNRRVNLRLATTTENLGNQKVRIGREYKGVHYYQSRNRYQAYIRKAGVDYQLGYFDTAVEAARAYDQAARFLFGKFARPNFPEAVYPNTMPPHPRRKAGGKPTVFRSDTHKECTICHEVKERAAFAKLKSTRGADPHESRCRYCNNLRRQRYR